MYVNPRSFLVTDPKCSFDSPPSDLVSLSCDMLENVQLVIDWQLVWSNLKKQVEEQKLTNWSWSCDKAGTIRIWPRSWAAAHVASANTDSFSSLFANKNLWNVWNACDWLRNIFFPKDIRAAFLQPETHVCCISVTFSANLAWTQLLEWQFTTYNYVSHVCSFTCADPGKLQHLGLFHTSFFTHFTFCRLFYADSWTCESFLQFLSLAFLLRFLLCFSSTFAADPDLTCLLPIRLQFGELWKRIWPSFGSCSLCSS